MQVFASDTYLLTWGKDAMKKPKKEMETDVKTLSVPDAGKRYFNLSPGGSYAAAARGDIPTVRIGRRIRAPIVALERMLAGAKSRQEDTAL
jgi:hypothetical protein